MKGSECKFVKYMEGSDKRFVIPVYQRNYDWKTENCKQLYDDLVKIIKGHRKSHFFGSLVSVYNPDGHNEEFLIIDGQQRLTTVSLLFLAMYNLIDKGVIVPETANLKQRIFEEYLVDKWKPEDTRIKLKPVKNDQTAFGKLFSDPTEHIRESNLTVNYDYFYDRIQKQEITIDQLYDAICCLEIINIRLDTILRRYPSMNEMIKAERNKICSRKQTRMLFLAGVVLIVAYFFFFQFNYQNVFYDYDLEKMALASGFTAIEQRKEVAEIFEGKLSQNTLLTMQEKIDQAKQATVGQDENSAFSAVHVYRDQAAILEYLTNSDGSFKSLETAYPNSPTVTLGYCDGWDKLLSGMGSILSIMICLIVVITLSPVFSEEYALHTDSIIYSARYGRTKLTTSKIIAALEVVIGTYLLYLLLNLVLYGCTYGLQGWNVSIQSSLHYASSIYNLTFLQMFFISVILNIFGIVALTTITLFLSAQMSSPVTALITSCVICFLPVVFDFNDSLPVLQKMQEICPIFMLHTNGIFSDMKTYFGMSQPVFMIILNVGLIFVFYRLTKNISKKHQVTG